MSCGKKSHCRAFVELLKDKVTRFFIPSLNPIEDRCKYFDSCLYAFKGDMVCDSSQISSNVCMEWGRLQEKEDRGVHGCTTLDR